MACFLHAFEHKYARDLGDGFELQYAWHDGMAREMALEIGFVDGDVFDADDLVANGFNHAINH